MTHNTVSEIHEKMGDCYKETGEYQLSLYHYTQQIALVSSPTTWTNIALLSLKDDQSYQVLAYCLLTLHLQFRLLIFRSSTSCNRVCFTIHQVHAK